MSKNQKIGVIRYVGLCSGLIASLGLVLTLGSGIVRANVFPNDAITTFVEVVGDVENQELLPASDITLLASVFDSSASNYLLTYSCGSTVISQKTECAEQQFFNFRCKDGLFVTITGSSGKSFFINFTYVDYDTTTRPILLASASADIPLTTYASMTAGDILIALLLFGLIMLSLLTIFLRKI